MSFDQADQASSNPTTGSFDTTQGNTGDSQPFLQIGERVFATPEDVKKFYESSQTHIQTLEEENKGFKETHENLQKAANENISARELLEGIKANKANDHVETPPVDQAALVAEAVRIAKIEISEELKSNQQKELDSNNLTSAMSQAEEYYGEDYVTAVNKIGKEHSMTGAQINNLAKTSPVAFGKLFMPDQKASATPAEGDINTNGMNKEPADTKVEFMKLTKVNERAAEITRRILAKNQSANIGE